MVGFFLLFFSIKIWRNPAKFEGKTHCQSTHLFFFFRDLLYEVPRTEAEKEHLEKVQQKLMQAMASKELPSSYTDRNQDELYDFYRDQCNNKKNILIWQSKPPALSIFFFSLLTSREICARRRRIIFKMGCRRPHQTLKKINWK